MNQTDFKHLQNRKRDKCDSLPLHMNNQSQLMLDLKEKLLEEYHENLNHNVLELIL